MEPFEPLFLSMCKDITVVLDNVLYKTDQPADINKDYVNMAGTILPLERLEHLAKMEEIDRINNEDEIAKWKTKYIKGMEKITDSKIKEEEIETELLEFIVGKVFPYFADVPKIDSYDSTQKELQSKSIVSNVESMDEDAVANPRTAALFRKLKRHKHVKVKKKKEKVEVEFKEEEEEEEETAVPEKCLFKNIFGSVFIMDDCVYSFKEPETGKNEIQVNLKGKLYGLEALCDLEEMKKRYLEEWGKMLKEEAMLSHPKILETKKRLEAVNNELKRDVYRNAGLSLICDNYNSYWICLDVPEYINKGEDGQFYRFPKNKVGVRLDLEKNGFSYTDPVIVHSSSHYNLIKDKKVVGEGKKIHCTHPFTAGTGDFIRICMGGFSPSGSIEERVVSILNTAKTTIMSGYVLDIDGDYDISYGHKRPINRLEKRNFPKYIISEKDVKKLGLQVTNRRQE